jgi:hypothetical protein
VDSANARLAATLRKVHSISSPVTAAVEDVVQDKSEKDRQYQGYTNAILQLAAKLSNSRECGNNSRGKRQPFDVSEDPC